MANNQVKGIADVTGGPSRLLLIWVFLISQCLFLPLISFSVSPHWRSLWLTVPAGCAPSQLLPLTAFVAGSPLLLSLWAAPVVLPGWLYPSLRPLSLLSLGTLPTLGQPPKVGQLLQKSAALSRKCPSFLVQSWGFLDGVLLINPSFFATKLQVAVLNPTGARLAPLRFSALHDVIKNEAVPSDSQFRCF